MRLPNFFILGAPKCGTTSLAAWLSMHPNVYMSPVKEPNFFNTDLASQARRTPVQYRQLFADAQLEAAVGEATPTYLTSKEAVRRIELELPGSKFIVLLRNPVEMAVSLYGEHSRSHLEDAMTFETAWRLSEERRNGNHVSRWCVEPRLLDYKRVCQIGTQLAQLLQLVSRNRVLTLLLDDLATQPESEYRRVEEFLGLKSAAEVEFQVKNRARTPRNRLIDRGLRLVGGPLGATKRRLGIRRGTGLFIAARNANTRTAEPPNLDPLLADEMHDFFRPEVEILERLLGRRLGAWNYSDQARHSRDVQ